MTPANNNNVARALDLSPGTSWSPLASHLADSEAEQKSTFVKPIPPVQQQKPRPRTTILFVLLALILVIFGVAAWVFFPRPHPAITAGPVGQVHFTNSGHAARGNYDEVQIDLTNIPDPPQGQVYYAWIESASSEQFRPHWQLTPHNGVVHTGNLTFSGHNTLLQPDTILLITRESSGSNPNVPTPDLRARLYYAQLTPLSQTVFSINLCSSNDPSHVCLQ